MHSSSSNKKLHYFDMPDELKWPDNERSQRLMRRAPAKPPVSNQPQLGNQNGSKPTEVGEKPRKARSSLQRSGKKSKPIKAEASLLEEKEPKSASKQRSKASTSKVPKEGEKLNPKKKISEAPPEDDGDQNYMPKFSISLTREEIEEDYFSITGKKLPRNKMKRDKTVQKGLDVLFPALSLEGHNAENLPRKY